MTDITELAQSLKAAAVRVIKNYDSEWFEAGHQICTVHKSKINLISLANPVNVLALVEALEAKDKQIADYAGRLNRLEKRCDHKGSVYWDASGVKRCARCGFGIKVEAE
ncbi:hypothetical protein CLJ39_07580 [Klebsiella pneumoniae]|uniref:hypothetical protein n=1 Tax=Klebsiella pneumoniae TaxID=573 RepID=UPI000A544FB0|nr:hypothetical protein [Klebsiella pneumoniae]EJG9791577.1 hypothetical protein [Klebsiella pneumoniae]EKU6512175.1 hypothetical protein [Klebsiella pneumoniae]HBT5663093.1 hypothetical protein [Klebsiella pneumoniae]HBV3558043.1 hypothetical protein [Klebsiella pneumoniae]